MPNKATSNLFSNFDDIGTEANAEIIKNSINSSKSTTINNDHITKEPIKDISSGSKSTNIKLANLVAKLPKTTIDKKSYMTIYLKKSVQVKIDEMSKKLGVSNGSIIELIINEFEQK
ncbi:hypothetical protein [Spiroplasma endosymbiont of Nebria brevicollis]|uniref:hypothetical protein n=1 Tax=Spiroplasma endosymbiont of Nebria brevicollis TaxID=3066284 RepID=UPI00313B479B